MKRALNARTPIASTACLVLAMGCSSGGDIAPDGAARQAPSADARGEGLSVAAPDRNLPDDDGLTELTPSRPRLSREVPELLFGNPTVAASGNVMLSDQPAAATSDAPHSFLAPQSWGNELGNQYGWSVTRHLRTLARVNYDTKEDLVGFGDDGVWVALSTGTKFDSARFVVYDFGYNQGWRLDKHIRLLEDLNNDGLDDIVAFGDDGVWTALSANGYFAPQRFVLADFGWNQGYRLEQHERLLADVNGDGRKDIVAFHDSGVALALGDGQGGFQPATPASADFGSNYAWSAAKHERTLADINRDGRADIVAFGDAGVWTALSTGTTFAPARFVLAAFGTAQGYSARTRLVVDIDHDANPEIVAFGPDGVHVARSTQDGGFAPPTFALPGFEPAYSRVADLDGDGYQDLVGVSLGNDPRFPIVERALGGPSGFSSSQVALIGFIKNEPFEVGDVDGDGRQDLMKLDFQDPILSGSYVNYVARSSASPIPPWPPSPSNLRVTAATSTSLTLAWSYPSNTDVRYFYLSGSSSRIVGLAKAVVTGLKPSTEYCFKVQAQNWFARSAATASVCAYTPASTGGGGGGGQPPTQLVCGITLNCPSGYHAAGYQYSSSCPEGATPFNNQTICAANSSTFQACGVRNCPAGWHAIEFPFAVECDVYLSGQLLPNASRCTADTNGFGACGDCPSGYTTTASASSFICDGYPWVQCSR